MLSSSRFVGDVEKWQLKRREQHEEKRKSLTISGVSGDTSPTIHHSVKPIQQPL